MQNPEPELQYDPWAAAHVILEQPDIASRIQHCYSTDNGERYLDVDQLRETIGPWSTSERLRVRVAADILEGQRSSDPVTLAELRDALLDPGHRDVLRRAAFNSGAFAPA